MAINAVGKTIRIIRKSKNIKSKDLYHNIVSRSFYSKFEKGNCDTTTTIFFEILENLPISFEEFMYIHNNHTAPLHVYFCNRFHFAFLSNDISTMKSISEGLDLIIDEQKSLTHLSLTLHLLINKKENKEIDASLADPLKDYLLNCQIWSYYELTLFTNILFIFDIELVDVLIDRALLNIHKFRHLNREHMGTVMLLFNLISLNINHNRIPIAKIYLAKLKKVQLRPNAMFEKNIILFIEGIVLKKSAILNGDAMIKRALNNFLNLDMTECYATFNDYFLTSFFEGNA